MGLVIWIFQQLQRVFRIPTNSDEIELQAQAAVRRALHRSGTPGWRSGAALTSFAMQLVRSLPEEVERGICTYHIEFEWRDAVKRMCHGSAEVKVLEVGEDGYVVDFITLCTQTENVHYNASDLGDIWIDMMPVPLDDKPALTLLRDDLEPESAEAA